ncbi:glycine reductase [Natronincola peptidivorans]|uniref:Glycine reductase n=3 Tax=Natronincola peptidivorans TaxID=426128 RepID=A0A1I0H7J9_9FIRM|nr:glycine reductase [Natronincola peptidivorans]
MSKKRVVHYINQFFAGIGGEEKADIKPEVREGVVGPGMAINTALKEEAEIVATVICGDSYFNENVEVAQKEILDMIKQYKPDLFIAGPAFNAGRYGVACGTITKAVQDELGIPVVTGMYIENPGADMFKKSVYIVETGNSAATMRAAVPAMVNLALKLLKGEEVGSPEEDKYISRGIRKNYFAEERGSKRAVDMLIKKLKGEDFVTEYPMPDFDRVEPNPAVKDLSKAKIALVTSGGIVPKGNPDRVESSSASKYGKYDIANFQELTEADHETAHGGYDPVYANEDPDRVLPVDVLRDLEKEGAIGELHRYFYTTVGNGTSVASSKAFASEFAKELIADGVEAVILTST